jgi:hypothetical protein
VYISKNPDFRLPADPLTPIIMVGPGTGLAPFRSFILHRLLEQQQQQHGKRPQQQSADEAAAGVERLGPMVLYFGCRRRDQVRLLLLGGPGTKSVANRRRDLADILTHVEAPANNTMVVASGSKLLLMCTVVLVCEPPEHGDRLHVYQSIRTTDKCLPF